MKSYIHKPLSIKKSELFSKNKIFAPSRHKQLIIKNSSVETLSNLVELGTTSLNIGKNKGYYQYIEIGDINTTTGGISYKIVKSIDISSASVSKIQKDDILISTVRTYLGGIGIVTSTDKNLVATKALIVLRKMKKDISKYYLFGILRSKFFIDQVSMILNASMYPRMEKEYFDRLIIPFPTQKHNDNPKDVEKLVSLITQNIIDKEEQIKFKNQLIDIQIEKELKDNQKSTSLKYSYPKLSDLNTTKRLDTGLFIPKYKEVINYIIQYKNSFNFLRNFKFSWTSGSTPKAFISTNSINDNLWIAVADIDYGLFYNKLNFIKLKNHKMGLLKNGDILITRKGATVGKMNMFFTDYVSSAFVNEDIKVLDLKLSLEEKIFCGLFLNSKYGQTQLLSNGSKGTKQGLTNENILNVKIPSFPKEKQKEIAKSYYNKVDALTNISLDNYLTEHKKRNQKLGIFQLNMEIFELKEKLENLVDKIVMDEKIDIQEFF
jgi:hypothetical protein